MNILIVEDDFVSRNLLQRILIPYAKVDIAVDGEEALRAFEDKLKADNPYDLVCLDIMIPKKHGHDVLYEMRALQEARNRPMETKTRIVMTTALSDNENKADAFAGHCDAYVTKPISKNKFLALLKRLGLPLQESEPETT
jgi:two-component system chemotaxis response regulator CheY